MLMHFYQKLDCDTQLVLRGIPPMDSAPMDTEDILFWCIP
jgi:hypothetical protein